VLGDLDGFAAPFGERKVLDREILFGVAVAAAFWSTAGRQPAWRGATVEV